MKKIGIITICIISLFCINGCGKKEEIKKPEITEIRAICNLATLKVTYNNVAKYEKNKGEGITHWFEKDREMWIEYKGSAKLGIDMSKVKMTIEEDIITISMPKATVLSTNYENLEDAKYVFSDDGLNKNEFTTEEQREAVKEAQNEMKKNIEGNDQLLNNAQTRAEKLIENYINELGNLTKISYKIKYVYEE